MKTILKLTFLILIAFCIVGCNTSTTSEACDSLSVRKPMQQSLLATKETIDSAVIKSLAKNGNSCIDYFITTIDTTKKLFIVWRSNEKSDCVSPMYDTVCVFAILSIYHKQKDEWILHDEYKFPDCEHIGINVDSSSNIKMAKYIEVTGYSSQKEEFYYSFRDGNYFMDTINILVSTKGSVFGESYSWTYSADLKTKKLLISTGKTMPDDANEDILSKDTVFEKTLKREYKIMLGSIFLWDTIIGTENCGHFY